MAKHSKIIRPKSADPKFTGRGGFKHTAHDAKWLGDIIGAVKAGTPGELKGLPIAYHGSVPHAPDPSLEARPSSEISEPVDVPNVAPEQTRPIDPTPCATAHGMKSANTGGAPRGTVPAKLG